MFGALTKLIMTLPKRLSFCWCCLLALLQKMEKEMDFDSILEEQEQPIRFCLRFYSKLTHRNIVFLLTIFKLALISLFISLLEVDFS